MTQLLGEERRELETRSTLGSSEVARVVPGAFWDVAGEGRVRFPPPPAPPPPRTAFGGGGLLTLTLRGKAMDGFEEQQERTRPQLCPPSLKNRRTDAGFPRASTGRRRFVAGFSL